VGFAHTVDVRARESQLQHGTFVLHFSHAGRVDCVAYTQPNELADRYRELLSNETMPETTLADRTLIRLFNRVDDDADPVTGAAVLAGAAFARDIFRIQGIHVFNRQAYQGFAALLLHDEACRDFTDCKDEAARAAAAWLLERGDDLPHVLRQWRRTGRRHVRLSKADRKRPGASGRRGRAARH
jgi:hypothetical protein